MPRCLDGLKASGEPASVRSSKPKSDRPPVKANGNSGPVEEGGRAGFGVTRSDRRSGPATGMPECDDLQVRPRYAVVQEIAYSREIQPSDLLWPGRLYLRTNPGLFDEDRKGRLQILTYGTGCGQAILGPPFSGSLDLPLSAWLDSSDETHNQVCRRSRSNSSSAEMPSSRSASSSASRSSASS